MICPDCKGSGQYVGFKEVEPCIKCAGHGHVPPYESRSWSFQALKRTHRPLPSDVVPNLYPRYVELEKSVIDYFEKIEKIKDAQQPPELDADFKAGRDAQRRWCNHLIQGMPPFTPVSNRMRGGDGIIQSGLYPKKYVRPVTDEAFLESLLLMDNLVDRLYQQFRLTQTDMSDR